MPPSPEGAFVQPERAAVREAAEEELRIEPVAMPVGPAGVAPAAPAVRIVSPVHREIEKVLEEDLVPLYRELSPDQRTRFRVAGEEAVGKIETLLRQAAVKVKDIIGILIGWLSLLPGVNRFFIEQEAKLKADRLLSLKTSLA